VKADADFNAACDAEAKLDLDADGYVCVNGGIDWNMDAKARVDLSADGEARVYIGGDLSLMGDLRFYVRVRMNARGEVDACMGIDGQAKIDVDGNLWVRCNGRILADLGVKGRIWCDADGYLRVNGGFDVKMKGWADINADGRLCVNADALGDLGAQVKAFLSLDADGYVRLRGEMPKMSLGLRAKFGADMDIKGKMKGSIKGGMDAAGKIKADVSGQVDMDPKRKCIRLLCLIGGTLMSVVVLALVITVTVLSNVLNLGLGVIGNKCGDASFSGDIDDSNEDMNTLFITSIPFIILFVLDGVVTLFLYLKK
jgi:hypothetical protein